MPTDDGESGDSGSVSLRVDGHNFDLSSIVQLEVSQLEADQLAVRLHRWLYRNSISSSKLIVVQVPEINKSRISVRENNWKPCMW